MFKKKNATPKEYSATKEYPVQKYLIKGTTSSLTIDGLKESQRHLADVFVVLSDKWDDDKLLSDWNIDYYSSYIGEYDNTWSTVVHDRTIPKEKRSATIIIRPDILPDNRIDISNYIGRDKEYTDKLIKVYDILLNDVKKYIEVYKINTEDNEFLREECGVDLYHFDWKVEDLGLNIIPEYKSDGKRKLYDVSMNFAIKLTDKDKIVDNNLNPFRPSSLAEFNITLNKYYRSFEDLEVLAAVHKWFQNQINFIDIENKIFKEAFNIK